MTNEKIEEFLKELSDAGMPFLFACHTENIIRASSFSKPSEAFMIVALAKVESLRVEKYILENT